MGCLPPRHKPPACSSYHTTRGGCLMQGYRKHGLALFAGLAILGSAHSVSADDLYNKKSVKTEQTALPAPAEVKALTAQQQTVLLKGQDDSAQLVITAQLEGRL